jgi:hypothetical protein
MIVSQIAFDLVGTIFFGWLTFEPENRKDAKIQRGNVVLCNTHEQINEVLKISGFLTMFK